MTFQSHILLDEFLRSCPALDFDWATVSPWFFFFFSNSVVDLLECLGSLSCAKFSENQTAYKHEDLIQAAKYRTIVEGWWSQAWTLCSHWAHRELSIQKDDQFQPRISCQRDGLTFDCRIFWIQRSFDMLCVVFDKRETVDYDQTLTLVSCVQSTLFQKSCGLFRYSFPNLSHAAKYFWWEEAFALQPFQISHTCSVSV